MEPERLKAFKDQLLLTTSGNPTRFPNVQHKLRYAYQLLAGRARRTMCIHLRRTTAPDGEETYEILFNSFSASLAALDHHFGGPDEKHTAALALIGFAKQIGSSVLITPIFRSRWTF